jgi:NitT/TauT family transport system permease protein
MSTSVADPPLTGTPPALPPADMRLPAAAALLSPSVLAAAALAVHRYLPNKQEPPLSDWPHPYPIVLTVLLIGPLLAAVVYIAARRLRPAIRYFAPLFAGAAAWMLVWEYATVKRNWLRLPFFPGPDEVFGAMIEDHLLLLESAGYSLLLLICGYLAGVLGGIITGVLIGWYPSVRYWAMPAVKFFGPIPATALLAVVFALWKDAFPGAVALIAFAVWFPVNILTSSGIANVRLSYLDVARTLGAGERYLIFRVAIPAAMPNIFIGMFMGLVVSFLTLNVAEMVGVPNGLGWYMRWQLSYMEYAKMYGSLILSAVLFSTLLTLLFKLRDFMLSWQRGVIKW